MRFVRFLMMALFLASMVGIGYWTYSQREEQNSLRLVMEKLKDELAVGKPSALTHYEPCPPGKNWCDVQSQLRDTVVQIFSQIAEFDWREPYRSPAQYQATGSGFFINDSGDIITNAHVTDQATDISIQIPSLGKQRFYVTKAREVSPERDLAQLHLMPEDRETIISALGRIPYLKLGDSDLVHRADEVMALGYPLGQQSLKSTIGVVSGREHLAGQHLVQTDAPINPGNSGGPSINKAGEVVGINSAGIREAQNVGYFIPVNELKLFLRQLEQIPNDQGLKFLRKPFLGVLYNNASETLTDFLDNPRPGGLYVVETYKGSPLQKAGIENGDMIYEINGLRLDVFGELRVPWSEDKISIVDYISRLMVGDQVHLVVYRKGARKEFTFTFGPSELAPIRRMYPGYEKIDYIVIGGMVIMQLALNHLPLLIQAAPELAHYAELKKQMEPALIVTNVLPGSAAFRSRAIGIGSVISEVNGIPVKMLDEFAQAVKKGAQNQKGKFLTIKTSENVFAALPFEKILEEERMLSQTFFYPLSPLVQELLASFKPDKPEAAVQATPAAV